MTKRLMLLCLACSLWAGGSGCGVVSCLLCPSADCQPEYCAPASGPACGHACDPGCEPACGPATVAVCEPACGTPPAAACDVPCGPPLVACGPLTWVLGLFDGHCWDSGGCEDWHGGGCGEMYCGDYCSDPPDCCEPCDQWGNYTGGGASGYHGSYTLATAPQDVRVDAAPEVIQAPAAAAQ